MTNSISPPDNSVVKEFMGNASYSKMIKFIAKLPPEQIASAQNAIDTFSALIELNFEFKQKTPYFDPTKKIRFNVSPIDNLEIWMGYTPNSSSAFSKKDIHSISENVNSKIQDLFPYGSMRDALLNELLSEPVYLKEDNWDKKLRKLQSSIITKSWFSDKTLEFIGLFPKARRIKRKVFIFAGETSSGKTYQALKRLKAAETGAYVGPLRLNALEVYDELTSEGIVCDLLTGEEKVVYDGASHQASTVELMPFTKPLDCAVIDEAQLMDDEERGHSFVSAILGAIAKEICITCPPWAVDKIKALCEMVGDDVEVVLLERKTKLVTTQDPIYDFPMQQATAIVAFSRKRIFQIRKLLPRDLKVGILYGGMPPEVRREQARKFRNKEVDVLISTDCIGLGLNLPIEHLVFDTVEKFDGVETRLLTQGEVLQIAGRAGRFGIFDIGYVSGMGSKAHNYIGRMLEEENHTVMLDKYFAAVPFFFVREFMEATGIQRISAALTLIYENVNFDSQIFDLTNIDVIMENLIFIEKHASSLDPQEKWVIAHMPVQIEQCERVFYECLQLMSGMQKNITIEEGILNLPCGKQDTLFELERLFAQVDCVRWFLNRFPERVEEFADPVLIEHIRKRAEKKMNESVASIK